MFNSRASAINKIKATIALLTFKSFDISTPEGRSKERYRRATLTSLTSLISKGIVVLTSLISVPLTLGYLGPERYGMWMTISSIIALLSFVDLGMGNSLKNHIASAHGQENRILAKNLTSSAYVVLSVVVAILGAIFASIYSFIPWEKIFNVSTPQAISESGPAVVMFVVCFLLNIPLGLIVQIQTGYQEGAVNNIWQSIGSLLGLIAVLLVIWMKGGLPWLILAMAGIPCVMNLFNSIYFFFIRSPWLKPQLHCLKKDAMKSIMHTGWLFLFGQIVSAVAQSSDNLIVAQVLGSGSVAEFSVSVKLFSILSMIQNVAVTPFWPAYGEAIARGDIPWIRKTLSRTIVISVLVTLPLSVVFVVFGQRIIHLWTNKQINPDLIFLSAIATWTVISAISSSVAMLLSGATVLKEQILIGIALIIVSLSAKIFLGHKYGAAGIMWGGVIAYFFVVVVPYLKIGMNLVHKLENKNNPEVVLNSSNV